MNPFKNAAATSISARILAYVQAGMTVREAFDAVLGEGAYSKLAGEVYGALRGGL